MVRFAYSRCAVPDLVGTGRRCHSGPGIRNRPSQRRAVCPHPSLATDGASEVASDIASKYRIGMAPRLPAARGSREGCFMKRFGTALAAVALVALCVTAGCNDYGNTFQQNTGAFLQSLSPSNIPAAAPGSPDLILTVIGGGFVAKTVVQWDGNSLVTSVTLDVNNKRLRIRFQS